jgi:16S rRNA (uracil1498-N3)-methyltransferase
MELPDILPGKLTMRRFFFDKTAIEDGKAVITGNLFRHMAKVLRLKIGTSVTLVDRESTSYTGIIQEIGRDNLVIKVEMQGSEPVIAAGPGITLFQGLPKGNKMELILQKSTELGVSKVIPFAAERSIPRPPKEREAERLARWQRICLEAARQSNRSSLPEISPIADFVEMLGHADQTVKLLLWEMERTNRLKTILEDFKPPESVAVLVGPEGGLTTEEAKAAMEAGFVPITLGPRILRTETAAIAILAILQFFWGDIG